MSDSRMTKCPKCKADCTLEGCAFCETGKWRPKETVECDRLQEALIEKERQYISHRDIDLRLLKACEGDRDALRKALAEVLRTAEAVELRKGELDPNDVESICPWCFSRCNAATREPHEDDCEAEVARTLLRKETP